MRFDILSLSFSICRLHDISGIDFHAPFTFFGKTDTEFSLVCPTANVPPVTQECSSGWRGLRVCGQMDFSLTGVMAEIASTLAAASIPLFAVSTFDTDYVFLKAEHLERAKEALTARGHIMNDTLQMKHEGED